MVKELSDEFSVTSRTIQRDLNDRLSYLPIKKNGNIYFLESHYLGKLNFNDIKSFAILSCIKQLYPTLQESFLKDILDSKTNQAYLVKGYKYENLSNKKDYFKLLETAILNNFQLIFTYKDNQRIINPYKLVNLKGIWYLLGIEIDSLKTFTFNKLSKLSITEIKFKIDYNVIDIIKNNDNICFSKSKIDVILDININVADYFKRRNILPNQKIIKENKNNLILSTQVSFDEEILKIVRYWIPNVRILEPLYLQEKLESTLKRYLNI